MAGAGSDGRWGGQASSPGLLTQPELAHLRRVGSVRHAEVGTVVAAAGSVATHVQVVSDGELELMARTDGGRVTMAVVRQGGVILDIPVLLGRPMPFDAVASRETEMVLLSRERWGALLHSSPTLAVRWMASIAHRLDDERRRLVVMTSKPLVAQVAYLLLELAETDGAGRHVVRLSHTTLGHLLGVHRQSVTRVVAQMRHRGLVATRYGATEIVDPGGLHELMGSAPLP